jgi:hypothetical protein
MDEKLKFARCMRENGVPTLPDPTTDGQFPAFDSSSSIDPLSPRFK